MEQITVTFLTDLTVALVAARVFGGLARAAKITPALGYVLAGVVIGPFTPGYHTSAVSLGGLSELGLILLLFSLGLGFSPRDLRAVGIDSNGRQPRPDGRLRRGRMGAWVCSSASRIRSRWGWHSRFRARRSASRCYRDLGSWISGRGTPPLRCSSPKISSPFSFSSSRSTPAQTLTPMGAAVPLLKAEIFVTVALVLGATVLHRIVIGFLRRAPADAMVAFCTAVALVAAWVGHVAGLSFEFGAFVAGAVTSEAAGSRMVQSIVAPFRELFVMLFFVSIGTLVDVRTVFRYWPAILTIGAILASFGSSRGTG